MNRKKFITTTGLALTGLSLKGIMGFSNDPAYGKQERMLYIGTYSDAVSGGVNSVSMDTVSGRLTACKIAVYAKNPSFLALSPDGKFLFAVDEIEGYGASQGGAVSSFRIVKGGGQLELINSQPSMGAHPCHLTVSRNGKFVLVANYTGGNVAVLPVSENGTLGEPVCVKQHTGKGPNINRQEKPHAHSITLSPDNQYAYVCDLGIDRIMIYRFDTASGQLTPGSVQFFQTAPGAGPRHFCFSPDNRRAFVINELNSKMTSLDYDPSDGSLREIQTLSTLPDDFKDENTCADIHVHPGGRFVYGSNRGHDSIAVFGLDPETGHLKPAGHQPVGGKTPRNFAIDPTGTYLLAANQNSNTINVFKINLKDGSLSPTGNSVKVEKPVCILMTADR